MTRIQKMAGYKLKKGSHKKKEMRTRNKRLSRLFGLSKDEDSSGDFQDTGEFIKKCFPERRIKNWREKVLKGNHNQYSNMGITSETENDLFNKLSNGLPLYAGTNEGRENVLMKDDLEPGLSSPKQLDPYLGVNNSKFSSLEPVVVLDKLDNGTTELTAFQTFALNNDIVTTFTPVPKRKFFVSGAAKRITLRWGRPPSTTVDEAERKYLSKIIHPTNFKGKLANYQTSKDFGRRKGITLLAKETNSEEKVRNEFNFPTGNCNSAQLTDSDMELDKKSARPATSLQPTVMLRKMTVDEIRQYTSQRLTPRKRDSRNRGEQDKSVDHLEKSGVEAAHSCQEGDKIFCNGRGTGCKNSYSSEVSRKREFFECSATPCRNREMQQLCKRESEKSENQKNTHELHQERSAKFLDSEVLCNGTAKGPQDETPIHHGYNGGREDILEETARCSSAQDIFSKYRNGEGFSRGGCSNTEDGPNISTGKGAPLFTVLANNRRKCCGNEVCDVATPELIGLENSITSNRCWMNVTLQTLFAMKNFMQNIVRAFEEVNLEENSLFSCIQRLYHARSLGHQECVYKEASKLAEVLSKSNSDYTLNDQQDPSEFILWLLNAFEPALENYGPSWASDLITENFRFEMEERTLCVRCMKFDVSTSSFLILMLDIHVGTSTLSTVEEALAAYTTSKIVERTCSYCGEDSALVKTAFKSLPRYLIINLKRYSVKGGEVVRDETQVRHNCVLSLTRYTAPNGVSYSSKEKRNVAVTCSPKFNIGLKSLRRSSTEYQLISVIHHSGYSVFSGHYICDVYHRATNKWYSYNDKMVKEITAMAVLSSKKQRTGYIYIYESRHF